MGIVGLPTQLKDAYQDANVGQFKGKTVVVDALSWLHKACYGCAFDLALGKETQTYITYVMRRVDLLKNAGIHPILVFDGKKVPLKATTHDKRKSITDANRDLAMKSLHDARQLHGDERKEQMAKTHTLFQRSVKVTSDVVFAVHAALRAASVAFVIAPFEADAQMVYLCKAHNASAIITEDSDILVYSITANVAVPILLKLDYPSGACKMVSKAILKTHGASTSSAFLKKLVHFLGDSTESIRMFVQMCILSGCDFIESLPNIGPVTAQKHVFAFRGAPGHLRIQRILAKLKMDNSSLAVPADYLDRCRAAEALFYHHYVYNPDSRTCEYLVNAADYSMTKDIYDLVTCAQRGPSIVGVPVGANYENDSDKMHAMYHGHQTPAASPPPNPVAHPSPAFIAPPATAPVVSRAAKNSDDEERSTPNRRNDRRPSNRENESSSPQALPSQRRVVASPSGIVSLLDQYRRGATVDRAKRPLSKDNTTSDVLLDYDLSDVKRSRHWASSPSKSSSSAAQNLFDSLQAMPEPSGTSHEAAAPFARTSSAFATPAKGRSSHQTPPSATTKKATKPLSSKPPGPSPAKAGTLHAFFSKNPQPTT